MNSNTNDNLDFLINPQILRAIKIYELTVQFYINVDIYIYIFRSISK